jgi:RimJ/RimL family protein N-acetyltransferase
MARAPETLETERLQLRQFTIDDLDAIRESVTDPEVMRYLGGTLSKSWEFWRSLASLVGHWQLRGYGIYAVEEKSSGALVGRVGLLNPVGWPSIEIAWTLARPHWGKGYATEAAAAVARIGFGVLEAERLISLIDPQNLASQKVAERLGAVREGTTDFFGSDTPAYIYRHEPSRYR